MRKISFVALLMASVVCYGQDELPNKPGIPIRNFLRENVFIHKSVNHYSGKTYTEVYEIITDSVVSRFGMEFLYDSTFVRRVPMKRIQRKLYDRMRGGITSSDKEHLRKETIGFINRYSSLYEIWEYLIGGFKN